VDVSVVLEEVLVADVLVAVTVEVEV